MRKLPVDERGYPVPFFVGWVDEKPEFRAADPAKLRACKLANLCWVCGSPLEETFAFVIGPMCALNRTTAEPPAHVECAEFSVRGCPFLTKPQMTRREVRESEALSEAMVDAPGHSIRRNPGASALWATSYYETFPDGSGGELIKIGPAESVSWWREGRAATRDEVLESISTGLPLLIERCEAEATAGKRLAAHRELDVALREVESMLPEEA